tara:strand:- start:4768 stop:5064 length:297 start_codon:yes stop_codon:yes gene_type:complete
MLGLSYKELYDLTPRSLDNKLRGFRKYNEQLSQNQWEQTRTIVHSCIVPHSKHRLKPKELMPFPWDKKNKIKKDVASKEHIQEVLKKYKLVEPKKIKL